LWVESAASCQVKADSEEKGTPALQQHQKDFFFILSFREKLRQAKIRESLGLTETFRFTML
jgi:hypothetical protein